MMTDTHDGNAPISFVRWLHAQVKADKERAMPYSNIYRWGPNIHAIIGSDGRFDSEKIALEIAQQGATAEDLASLVSAEAAWRVDSLVESAEIAGVILNVPGGTEEIISPETTKEIEKSATKVLCGYRNHRGEGCIAEAVEGAGRCGRHGGAITDPEVRRSFLLVAFAKVIDGSRVAVEALLDVAENGRSEMARVQAAKELLDRAGVQQDQHVHIHRPEEDTSEDELVAELRRRLSTASDRLRIQAIPMTTGEGDTFFEISHSNNEAVVVSNEIVISNDDDIIDAEIIESDA